MCPKVQTREEGPGWGGGNLCGGSGSQIVETESAMGSSGQCWPGGGKETQLSGQENPIPG